LVVIQDMKIKVGQVEFEGTPDEMNAFLLRLDDLIAKASKLSGVTTTTAATATPAQVEIT
jgi:hypothetical protein